MEPSAFADVLRDSAARQRAYSHRLGARTDAAGAPVNRGAGTAVSQRRACGHDEAHTRLNAGARQRAHSLTVTCGPRAAGKQAARGAQDALAGCQSAAQVKNTPRRPQQVKLKPATARWHWTAPPARVDGEEEESCFQEGESG